jgi:hypothetical protein
MKINQDIIENKSGHYKHIYFNIKLYENKSGPVFSKVHIFFGFFVMTITVKKNQNITNFRFTHIIKQLMTLDLS